jgi:hypothetical protein
MSETVNVTFEGGFSRVPLVSSYTSLLQKALAGGSPTAQFFQYQAALAQFVTWLNDNENAWTTTTDKYGNPIAFAMWEWEGTPIALVLNISPTADTAGPQMRAVPLPAGQPATITRGGEPCHIIGQAAVNLTIGGVSFMVGNTLIISTSAVGASMFAKLAAPFLRAFWNGAKSTIAQCFGIGAEEEAVAAAGEAAGAAAVEVTEEGIVFVTAWTPLIFFTMVTAFAIAVASYFLLHYSYHNIKLVNCTPFDLYWAQPYLAHGLMSAAPMTSKDDFLYLIPAVADIAPDEGINPVPMATQVEFAFQSASTMSSVGYVLPVSVCAADEAKTQYQQAALLFDVPWSGDNSLYAQLTGGSFSPSDLEKMYSSHAGKYQQTAFSAQANFSVNGKQQTLRASLTFDALSGEQKMPNGSQEGFYYNSLVTFELVS